AVAREIEDIEALIDLAGGSACVYGISSGAALAFEAALALGDKVKKLAMYEAPYNDDPGARQRWRQFRQELKAALAEGRRGDALGLFMILLGMPADQLEVMRPEPFWPVMEAVAPTIAYDVAILGEEAAVPTERAARLTTPALIMDGAGSAETYPFMHVTAVALAQAMPNAEHRTLPDQTHEVAPEAMAPVLMEYFSTIFPVVAD
ncbi:MAG TPA: hypothetical protein VHO69_02480, partial [Phototrophicaceae bacterium]|nr:hypothetical protein [Phototrophicaceae bacterium]